MPETQMEPESQLPSQSGDKPLFTPGPLTTSASVKRAMLRDLGSRDQAFLETVAKIRRQLLEVAEVAGEKKFEAIPLQGSGTYGLEAVLATAIPPKGRLLCVVNGSYGQRMAHIAKTLGIKTKVLSYAENTTPEVAEVEALVKEDGDITHVSIVHCETTTGIINPVAAIGKALKPHNCSLIVDAMSSFGAMQVKFEEWGVDWMISSANKCLEGVPGFCYVIARKEALLQCDGQARSVALDLHAQWKGLEASGQFRFTPPTHAVLALSQALDELEAEGGPPGRLQRYRKNQEVLIRGMNEMGFKLYLKKDLQGPIITTFRYPEHDAFSFDAFYNALNTEGYVIYPGKVTEGDCFRIGSIGRLYVEQVEGLLAAVDRVSRQQGWR